MSQLNKKCARSTTSIKSNTINLTTKTPHFWEKISPQTPMGSNVFLINGTGDQIMHNSVQICFGQIKADGNIDAVCSIADFIVVSAR